MNRLSVAGLILGLMLCGRAFALGVDVGPVHIHGTKVKVGNTTDLKIVIDSIVKDDAGKVTKLNAHRKGDSEDKFLIKVDETGLDEDSREFVKAKMTTGNIYQMRIEKLDDDWKLIRIRKDED